MNNVLIPTMFPDPSAALPAEACSSYQLQIVLLPQRPAGLNGSEMKTACQQWGNQRQQGDVHVGAQSVE